MNLKRNAERVRITFTANLSLHLQLLELVTALAEESIASKLSS